MLVSYRCYYGRCFVFLLVCDCVLGWLDVAWYCLIWLLLFMMAVRIFVACWWRVCGLVCVSVASCVGCVLVIVFDLQLCWL